MPSPEDIVRHYAFDPTAIEYLVPPNSGTIHVVDYNPLWPDWFAGLSARIHRALGPLALAVEHVGSTSVPGLPAKPVIDIDVTVPDSRDEPAYRPALESEGFFLSIREPRWHEHRLFGSGQPRANIHVWSPDCPEVTRHQLFRDWLRTHPKDRELYAAAKLDASASHNAVGGGLVMDYNRRKEPVIREILARVFRAHGLLC